MFLKNKNIKTNFKFSSKWQIGVLASLLVLAILGGSFLMFNRNSNSDQTAQAGSFTSISPTSGPTIGGTNVTLNGNFAAPTVTQISTGRIHTCALLSTGNVRCWGNGLYIGYGNGNTRIGDNETPASAGDVNVGGNVIQIATGSSHTCALLSAGNVRCWGENTFGGLGYGNLNIVGLIDTPASAGDVNVGGTVTQISASEDYTCALLSTGNVRCWGQGAAGNLGYGNTNNIGDNETPASAGDVNVGGTVTQISAGDRWTCALLSIGNVRCWGEGLDGKLGYGNTNNIGDNETPASAGDVNVGGTVTQITTGARHTCALLSTGNVRCWGQGDTGNLGFGNLGYGNTNNIGDNETPASAGDVNVGGTVTQISAKFHTCVRLSTGNVRCWGYNVAGQLGYGDTTNRGVPGGDVSILTSVPLTVTFDGLQATSVVKVNNTTITAVTPAHAAGPVNVVINNTDGVSYTLANGYTYTETAITAANLQNPVCVPNQLLVESNQLTTCTFPLVGGGNYVLPNGSVTGKLLGPATQLGNNGSNCTINPGGTALVCTNIPATSLTPANYLPRGAVNVKVTFPTGSDFNSTNTPVTLNGRDLTFNDFDLGVCNAANPITLGNTFDCLFPIVGPINQIDTIGVNNPDLSNAFRAAVGQPQNSGSGPWSANSQPSSNANICSVVGTNLSCTGISTTTAGSSTQALTVGPADVILSGTNQTPAQIDKGNVTLTRTATPADLDKAISCTPDTALVNTTVTCSGTLDPYLTVENLTVKVAPTGTPVTCSTTGSIVTGLVITCLPANVGSNLGLLNILASTTGTGAVSNARVDDVTVLNAISEVLLIEADKILFNPTKAAPQTFSRADLVMTVRGDSRFTSNGANNSLTSVCRFKLKVFGANNSDITNGYPVTQTRLATAAANNSGQAIPSGLQGAFDNTTGSYLVPYDSANGCSIRLPTAQQNQPKWEYDIRVERSDGQLFGSPEAYFMLYGAIGQVSIGVS